MKNNNDMIFGPPINLSSSTYNICIKASREYDRLSHEITKERQRILSILSHKEAQKAIIADESVE